MFRKRPGAHYFIEPMKIQNLIFVGVIFAASLSFVGVALAAQCTKPATTASYYSDKLEGRLMANGKPYRASEYTMATWDYPLGTTLRVRHGGREVFVLVTDRGPAKRLVAKGRRFDLSRAAFEALADTRVGVIEVEVAR